MGPVIQLPCVTLKLRGAGDILGARQHGLISSIGLHLYTKLLALAVKNMREDDKDASREYIEEWEKMNLPVNVELPLSISIPESYIKNKDLRLSLYRRISDIRNESELYRLEEEFNDRFGQIPEEVLNLFYLVSIKIRAQKIKASSISIENNQIIIRFSTQKNAKIKLPLAWGKYSDGKKMHIYYHLPVK